MGNGEEGGSDGFLYSEELTAVSFVFFFTFKILHFV